MPLLLPSGKMVCCVAIPVCVDYVNNHHLLATVPQNEQFVFSGSLKQGHASYSGRDLRTQSLLSWREDRMLLTRLQEGSIHLSDPQAGNMVDTLCHLQ